MPSVYSVRNPRKPLNGGGFQGWFPGGASMRIENLGPAKKHTDNRRWIHKKAGLEGERSVLESEARAWLTICGPDGGSDSAIAIGRALFPSLSLPRWDHSLAPMASPPSARFIPLAPGRFGLSPSRSRRFSGLPLATDNAVAVALENR